MTTNQNSPAYDSDVATGLRLTKEALTRLIENEATPSTTPSAAADFVDALTVVNGLERRLAGTETLDSAESTELADAVHRLFLSSQPAEPPAQLKITPQMVQKLDDLKQTIKGLLGDFQFKQKNAAGPAKRELRDRIRYWRTMARVVEGTEHHYKHGIPFTPEEEFAMAGLCAKLQRVCEKPEEKSEVPTQPPVVGGS